MYSCAVGDRTFAGYAFRERLEAGYFGEVYRGIETTGKEARLLSVCPAVARQPGLAAALERYGLELEGFEHLNVVATRAVGELPDGSLVVVNEAVNDPLSLRDLMLSAPGGKLPVGIALSISEGILVGLAQAHGRGLIHGGLHPRSVLIDKFALVKLADFAVSRTTLELALEWADLEVSYRGYLAPELAQVAVASPAADVYAVGAIMYTMLAGGPLEQGKPGRLAATTSIRRLVTRAIDDEPTGRFADAVEMKRAFDEAIEADGSPIALPSDLFDYVEEARNVKEIFVARERDLASILDRAPAPAPPPAPPPAEKSDRAADPLDPLDAAFAGLEDDEPVADPLAPLLGELGLPSLDEGAPVDEDEEPIGEDSQLTQVDDLLDNIDARDPISEMIELEREDQPTVSVRSELDDEATPLPAPMADHEIPGSFTRQADQPPGATARPVVKRAADAIAELEAEQEREEREAVSWVDTGTEDEIAVPPRKLPPWTWMAMTGFALVVLLLLVYTQTDVFHPERAQAKREAAERRHKEAERKLRAEQKKGGNIIVDCNQDGAAVWLLLGRTPVDSMPLPTNTPHQLRFEREGYVGEDMVVKASNWTGDRATITRTLRDGKSTMPAWPPPLPESAKQGFSSEPKLGVIHLETTPPGVQVWLLVGYTPEVRLTDFEAGIEYEFKVRKDGFRPGVAVIHAADWQLDPLGNPTLYRGTIVKRVDLEPVR